MALFNKKIDPQCSYCTFSHHLTIEEIICDKKGIRDKGNFCKKFRYDPLKRIPPRPKKMDFSGFSPEDFVL